MSGVFGIETIDDYIGTALIENDVVRLSKDDVDFLLQPHPYVNYPTFIHDTFFDIYYTGRENKWLDMVVQNIENLDVFDIDGDFDLVYIDTPYISKEGVGVDYLDFYHFKKIPKCHHCGFL